MTVHETADAITVTSQIAGPNLTADYADLVLRLAISRVLDVRLPGEIDQLANASSLNLFSVATKATSSLT